MTEKLSSEWVAVHLDDWVAIYHNGKLVAQDHSFDVHKAFKLLGVTLEYVEGFELLEKYRWLPDNLQEVWDELDNE